MKPWIRIFFLAIFTSSAAAQAVLAEGPRTNADSKAGNIEMKEAEIQGSLKDIVGTFKLDQMEIFGDIEAPKITYDEPWELPDPFYLENDETTRHLIEQATGPIDRDSLGYQAGLISGPSGLDSSELASKPSTGFLGMASLPEPR